MNNSNKILKPILYLGWVFAFVILWLNGCNENQKDNNSVIVTTPEVNGNFEPTKPNKGNEITQAYIDSIKATVKNTKQSNNNDKYISDISALYNENEALKQQFLNETDSLKRELMYLKAIQLSEYYKEFDDDYINAMVKVISPGDVKLVSMDYTVKKREQLIDVPETKFRFLAGGTIGNSTTFNNPLFSAGIGFQNKKGNIILGSFDTEKRISISYYQSILKIKK